MLQWLCWPFHTDKKTKYFFNQYCDVRPFGISAWNYENREDIDWLAFGMAIIITFLGYILWVYTCYSNIKEICCPEF